MQHDLHTVDRLFNANKGSGEHWQVANCHLSHHNPSVHRLQAPSESVLRLGPGCWCRRTQSKAFNDERSPAARAKGGIG